MECPHSIQRCRTYSKSYACICSGPVHDAFSARRVHLAVPADVWRYLFDSGGISGGISGIATIGISSISGISTIGATSYSSSVSISFSFTTTYCGV